MYSEGVFEVIDNGLNVLDGVGFEDHNNLLDDINFGSQIFNV